MDEEKDILRDMASESDAFAALVARVHDEATKTINAAAKRLEASHAVLQRRLLIARLSSSPPSPRSLEATQGIEAGGERKPRSAREVIMTLLASACGPVASNELDKAVVAAGLTRAAAAKVVDGLTRSSVGGEGWQTTSDNGVTLHSLPVAGGYLNLTAAATDKHFILSLNAEGAKALLKQEKAGGANFTSGEAYKHSVAALPKADQAFGYLDSKAFFERFYGVLKPAAMFGGAMMYPQVNDYVELGKLPDGEVISKHLSPIVLTQSADDEGVLVESVGPVTFLQAGFGVAGFGAAAAFPTLQKQYGLFGQPGAGADAPPAGASPTPGSAPLESP